MKKFLSNKNKMWISFVIMNLFAYVGLVFSNLIRGISILFSLGSLVLTYKCLSFIYENFFERNKNKYCDELSCRFFYNNKDILKIEDEKMNKRKLKNAKLIVNLFRVLIVVVMFSLWLHMDIMSIPGGNIIFGLGCCAVESFVVSYIQKLDINLSVVNNVINRIEASQLEANHNNDSVNEVGKNNAVSNQLPNRYVPGVSPTITEIMNRYNYDNSRRGPVRARRKPEDKRK